MIDYNNKNYYEVLGVDMYSTIEDIKEAYKRAKENVIYSGFIKKIDEAYEALSNPDKKREYDLSLAIDDDIKVYEPRMNTEKREKYAKLEELKNNYNKSIDEIGKLYDGEIYEYLKQNTQSSTNIPEKLKNYMEKYNEAVKISKEIENLCNELNIELEIENLDTTINKFKEREKKQLSDSLELAKEKYNQTLSEISKLYVSENFDEKDEKWVNLVSVAKIYYPQIVALSNMLDIKVDVIFVDDYLKQQKKSNKNNESNQDKEIQLKAKETQLISKYNDIVNKLVTIYNKNKSADKIDYIEWKELMEKAHQTCDEINEFFKKNNLNKKCLTVKELYESKKIPINLEEVTKEVELNKGKQENQTPLDNTKQKQDSESNSVDSNIYDDLKNARKELNPNLFDELSETYKFNQGAHKLILTAVGAGLGFTLLISPIGGFGILGSAIGSVLCGKLFNFITKKIQNENKFTLTRKIYADKITEIKTAESEMIKKQCEQLENEIKELSKDSDNFDLEVAKLKYQNLVNLIGQMIEVRKNTKHEYGEFTADSLNLAALKQEYNRAKKFLNDISKKIDRENMKKDVFAQDIDFDAIKYKNLTIGNFLIKQQINKNKKLKLQPNENNFFSKLKKIIKPKGENLDEEIIGTEEDEDQNQDGYTEGEKGKIR